MKTVIIHEWLVNYAGSERVLEQIIRLYPEADLYTVCDFLPEGERGFILNKATTSSFIQKLPFAKNKYRSYLPLMPAAVKRFDLSGYDVIISNSHSVAKGVRKTHSQLQICYCHTPMRYAWDLREQYLKESRLNYGIKGAVANYILDGLRDWDNKTAQQVDHFIANSHYIKDRIRRAYAKRAEVIYPPVDVNSFQISGSRDNYFLTASRMVPYKKMDLIVEAFKDNGLPLVVIGDGPDLEKVKAKAGKNVEFLGFQKDSALREHMQKARAFIFAAEEDFGILPVEAQACGTPVIAFGKGGVTETVVPLAGLEEGTENLSSGGAAPPTGICYDEQTISSLNKAVRIFQSVEGKFDPAAIRRNAERFGIERFRAEFREFMEEKIEDFF